MISIDGPDTLAVPPVVPPTAAAGGVASASAESEDMLHLNIEVLWQASQCIIYLISLNKNERYKKLFK